MFAVAIFPIGFTRIRSCCPAFVLIPVYELSGTFAKFIAKILCNQHDIQNIQLINGVDGTMVNLMLFVNNRMLVLMNDKDTQDIVLNLIEVEILNQGRDCSIHCLDNSNYT